MELNKINTFYFLGIGGIGMSALARYFNACGKKVSGYDKTPTDLTAELVKEGIPIHFEDDIRFFLEQAAGTPAAEVLVIYTPAVPKDHAELNYFKDNGYAVLKRSEVLGLLTKESFTVAVAGTHGKTTTSSMIAHVLKSSGMEISAFLGGITGNYNTNLLLSNNLGTSDSLKNNIVVVEADEYDRSFLTLHPNIALITSLDADHLDIYGSRESMVESYNQFANQLHAGGKLIVKAGLAIQAPHQTYSIEESAQFKAENIRIIAHNYVFDLKSHIEDIKDITLGLPGIHNVENAVAASAAAQLMNVSGENIKTALQTYKGVKRRFDYQVKSEKLVYLDDYAHHPSELRACITSVKELYPGKKITGIFQPHLYSRTRDFLDGFAESLSLLDELILLQIYPARELPIEGITSQLILDRATCPSKMICSKEMILPEIRKRNIEVLLTLGAGDIDKLVEPLRNYLQNETTNA